MKTYSGGCHCKKVRYEADIDLKEVVSCNCSMCAKRGWLLAFIPEGAFRLLSGEGELTAYHFNTKKIDHLFCKTCGVASFGRGSDDTGNKMVAINVLCLDNVDTKTLTVLPYDGKNA